MQKTRAVAITVTLLVVCVSSGILRGLQAQVQSASAANPRLSTVRIVSADVLTYRQTPQGKIYTLLGNVVLASRDTKLSSEKIIWNEVTAVASSPGKLRLSDPYNTLTASTGVVYYKIRDARFRGSVVIVAQPRPQDRNAPAGSSRRQFDAPATVTTEKLNYNLRTRIAQIPTNLTLKQKDRTVVADQGTYETRLEKVSLAGNVTYTKPNGDKANFERFVAILKEGAEEFTGTGKITAVFAFEEEEDEPTPAGTAPTRSGQAPSSSPSPSAPAETPVPETAGGSAAP